MSDHIKKNVAIFISGRGSNMKALVDDMLTDRNHPAKPSLIVSNNSNAEGLKYAKKKNIDSFVFSDHGKNDYFENKTLPVLQSRKIDIICLAGFMKILSKEFITSFAKPILNIHPSLLPSFRGLNTHERVIKTGSLIHGATVHKVTAKIDDGPILGQIVIKIPKHTTPKKLEQLLLPKEHKLYKRVLKEFIFERNKTILLMESSTNI
ncbi:phosphoribosylglycinamide formyltransferase [Paracoccaceae bacterium]|nr:phosphoribosylglycinamide formyltransferase [Paracoccaceae bacterium]